MKKSELERKLKSQGCYLASHGKKHDKWINPKTGAFDFLPRHAVEVPDRNSIEDIKEFGWRITTVSLNSILIK